MSLTLRVVDSVRGRPAAELPVRLDRYDGNTWQAVDEGVTGGAGELAFAVAEAGLYRARAAIGQYFTTKFPEIQIIFEFTPGDRVELQVTPAGYSACLVTP
ncbi:hydroxyisourate hydrolase [Actinocorallia populi]|uniref:hydroxyisourate hydrolase n=1 Tax=Actinocorallia populi TaxID=2079200 RepID=UPI000D096246|nr:hydroxyisourate hydrolase [Actinocorallia populi]